MVKKKARKEIFKVGEAQKVRSRLTVTDTVIYETQTISSVCRWFGVHSLPINLAWGTEYCLGKGIFAAEEGERIGLVMIEAI